LSRFLHTHKARQCTARSLGGRYILKGKIMGKAQPIDLPSIHFPTKTKAIEFFKKMLNRYKDGDEVNHDDQILLHELILRHPDASDKIGIGIKRFFRAKSHDHPTSCFHLERDNGETTDFSYPECISSLKPTLEQYFYRACRQSVSEILTAKKNALFDNGTNRCCKTNEVVTKENSEYRHTTPSFSKMVNDFKKEINTPISKGMFVEDSDLQYATRFSDKAIETLFIEFHQNRANLDLFKKFER
jgi:hypothetical protein